MRYITLLFCVLLAACGPSLETRKEYVQTHDRPPAIESAIIDGEIRVGMTKEDVRAAWGDPRSINRSYYEGTGAETQWCYGRGSGLQCVYFENGYVTGWN